MKHLKTCPECGLKNETYSGMGYFIDNVVYFKGCYCESCRADLFAVEKTKLEQLRKKGRSIGVFMS